MLEMSLIHLFVLKYYEFSIFSHPNVMLICVFCLLNVQAGCLNAPNISFTMQCTANVSPKKKDSDYHVILVGISLHISNMILPIALLQITGRLQ